MKTFFILSVFLLFVGCNDKSVSKIYDNSYKSKTIPCLKLSVSPKNKTIEKSLKKLYTFQDKCEYLLLVSYKANIVCNSNQNAPKKTLSNFPNSYLRMEINKKMNDLIFSYYIDLNEKVQKDDLTKGFDAIKKNLKLKGA